MQLGNTRIMFEEDSDRLKVTLPLQRNWPALTIYTILLLVWIIALFLFVYLLFRPPASRGIDELPPSMRMVWIGGVVLWLLVWVGPIGRRILRWWQFYLAKREIVIAEKETFIIRRPVSLFGITDAYDRNHMAPFYESDQHQCLAFQYGNVHHIMFGLTLQKEENKMMIAFLNQRLFPHAAYDDDDDE